jgi:hypothetical protein
MPGFFSLPVAGLPAFYGGSPQRLMAGVWFAMGMGTMLAPKPLLELCVSREALPQVEGADNRALQLAFRCFGAQAVMVGILLGTSKLDARGHAIWGASLIPFFVFDYIAWKKGLLTPLGALGDLAGNLVFVACSAAGAGWV